MRSECVVFVYLPGQIQAVPAGILTIAQNGRDTASTFVYGSGYRRRENAISLDPVELPIPDEDGQIIRPKSGKALFGVFRDAAPDAWGRLVINDKYIRRQHHPLGKAPLANAIDLPEVEYLLRSRSDRVGNLDFRETPTSEEPKKNVSRVLHLEELVKEANRIAQSKSARVDVMTLMRPATGMGGARPKTTIEDHGEMWLAKFPMDDDRLPVTRIENGMLELAGRCEIKTIEHKLIHVDGLKEPVFMIKRFDRVCDNDGNCKRIGYSSALTALGREEFDQSSGSYQEIARHLQRKSDPDTQLDERKELFRRMVFNVMVNNDDDHLRNHGMLRLAGGRSKLSPVFDIVPRVVTPGVSSVRRLAIRLGSDGRDGTIENMLSDTDAFGLNREEAEQEICTVALKIASSWRSCLKNSGCTPEVIETLEETMSYASKVLKEICRDDDIEHNDERFESEI
jgi:serine/threonine-protein kinase HipA